MKDRHMVGRTAFGLATALVSAVLLAQPSFAAKPQSETPSVAGLEKALGNEDYAEARRQADGLLRSASFEDRAVAYGAYGRILLGLGQKDQARQYRALMARQPLGPNAQQLMTVYDAWLMALDGHTEAGIRTLEEIVDKGLRMPSTVEAADVLARLYLQRGDQKKAQRAVSRGQGVLKGLEASPGHLEALLRNRSETDAQRAKKLFDQAESQRGEKKLVEAGRLYLQICREFTGSDSADAAGYRIGQCLAELGNWQQALDAWQSFVEASPAGPWRGQAQVAVIDLALEHLGDPAMAVRHAAQAANTLDNGLNGQAEPTWRQVAFDVRLRNGALAIAEGRYEEAAVCFARAKQAVEDGNSSLPAVLSSDVRAGLQRLIDAARKRRPVLPEELGAIDRRAALAVAVGSVYNLARQYERAKAAFDVPLAGRGRGFSRTLRSFAALGRARALIGLGESPQAFRSYKLSLEEYDRASWHDETLREMALWIEEQADPSGTAVQAGTGAAMGKQPAGTSRRLPAAQEASSRADALPYWTRLIGRHPVSPHVPEALYHAGVLNAETGQWAQALMWWDRLVGEFPDSPWTGHAFIRCIDVRLDKQLDLAAASKCAAAAVGWLDRVGLATAAAAGRLPRGARPADEVHSAIQLRAGLLAFLNGRGDEATGWLEKALMSTPTQHQPVFAGHPPVDVEQLVKAVRNGKIATPLAVRQGAGKAAVALMLADLYCHAGQHEASIAWCNRVIDGHIPQVTDAQRSWALLCRGRSLAGLGGEERNAEAALADYLAAAKADPRAEWADNAVFLAANAEWSLHRNADRAIALWQDLLRRYPDSEETARSAYYVAVAYQWIGQVPEARRCFAEFLERYPDSPLCGAARSQLEKLASGPPQTSGKRVASASKD